MLVFRNDYSNRFMVVFGIFFFFKVVQIKVHLSNILMFYLFCFQVNENEAPQYSVIEDKVNKVVFVIYGDFKLPCHK